MLPAFMRIALFARPRQFNNAKTPVRHDHRLIQPEQADGAAVNDIFRQQRAALLKAATPALRRGVLVTAQGNMVGIKWRNIESKPMSKRV